jgi:hypothetical protein
VFTRSFCELWKEFGIAEAISLLEIGERSHMKDGVCACLTMNMKLNYKTWIGMLLLTGTLLVSAPPAFSQVSIGIQIGAPPPQRAIAVRPPCPDPGDDEYMWVDGYWYPVEGHYYWHRGYWTRPPYVGAVWVAPYYEESRYYGGYWRGPHGRFDHDHHWDHDGERDRGRWHEDNGKHKGWYKEHHDDGDRD